MGTKNDLTFVSRVFSKLISYFFVLTRMHLFRLQILLKPSIYRFLSMLQECKSQLSFATKIALPHVAGGFAVSNNKLITTTSASTKTMMTTLPLTSKLIRKKCQTRCNVFSTAAGGAGVQRPQGEEEPLRGIGTPNFWKCQQNGFVWGKRKQEKASMWESVWVKKENLCLKNPELFSARLSSIVHSLCAAGVRVGLRAPAHVCARLCLQLDGGGEFCARS